MKVQHKLEFSDGHSSVRFVVTLDDLKFIFFPPKLIGYVVLRGSISLSGRKGEQYHRQQPLLEGAQNAVKWQYPVCCCGGEK